MLAALDADRLERVWFPLGELTKPEVRDLARAAALPVADKPDSQDLCFLAGAGGREGFLRRHAPDLVDADAGGEIVDLEGRVVGRHRGQRHFTIGQRRGLGVSAVEPLYVVDKDARTGRVRVGPRAALGTHRVTVRGAKLTAPDRSWTASSCATGRLLCPLRWREMRRPEGTLGSFWNSTRQRMASLPVRLPASCKEIA